MKKNKRIVVSILLIIEVISVFLMGKSISVYSSPNDIKKTNKIDKDKFAMFISDGDGYVEYTSGDTFPDGYELNIDQSKCIDNNNETVTGVLVQNPDGSVTVTSNRTLYCYLYFDEEKLLTVDDLKGTAGSGGLLAKPADVTSWGDLAYRYVGVDTESTTINNYICINGKKCNSTDTLDQNETSPYLYRIIGITEDGSLKLIKATQLDEKKWYDTYESDIRWERSNIYSFLTSSIVNNIEYIPDILKNKLVSKKWNVGVVGDGKSENGNMVLTAEQATKMTNESKIGLLYLSDWYFAQNDGKGNQNCKGTTYCKSWLMDSMNVKNRKSTYEWTMTYYGGPQIYAGWIISYNGYSNNNTLAGSYPIRPVFYVIPEILLKGSGTIDDPYVIQEKTLGDLTKDKIDSVEGATAPSPAPADTNWGDLQYRYVGDTADNYICINGTDCNQSGKTTLNQNTTSHYLYRIIGITTDGQLKIIKATQMPEGTKKWYSTYANGVKWEDDKNVLFKWLTTENNVLTNDNYVPNKIRDKIINKKWNVGDVNFDTNLTGNLMYQNELKSQTTNNYKIGLMYVSDLFYAYGDGSGSRDCSNVSPYCISWLTDSIIPDKVLNPISQQEWTMSRKGYVSNVSYDCAWDIRNGGRANSSGLSSPYAFRPVFYLDSSLDIKSGTGKIDDPFVLDI